MATVDTMGHEIVVGSRVKPYTSTASSIPAWRDMRGTVTECLGGGWIRILWDCDKSPDVNPRRVETVIRTTP